MIKGTIATKLRIVVISVGEAGEKNGRKENNSLL